MPAARELLEMAGSVTATARLKRGQPLLDPALLDALCNASKCARARARACVRAHARVFL